MACVSFFAYLKHTGAPQPSDLHLYKRAIPLGRRQLPPRRPPPAACLAAKPPTTRIPSVEELSKLSAWTDVRQEEWEGELEIEGAIPTWLRGTYLRNGAGMWSAGDHSFHHLFDGFAMLVGVHFDGGRVRAAHRQVLSEAYKAARKNGRLCYYEFSESPKPGGLFAYIGDIAGLISGASITDNANVSVVQLGDGRVVCLTETVKGSIQIDPDTLETIGRFEYDDNIRGLMVIHSAHPVVTASELLTLLPDVVRPGYVVARMESGTNRREVVGRVDCRGKALPGWAHSFPVTENYVVVPEMPLRYSVRNLLRPEPTPLYMFEWLPEAGAYLHVMCKSSGKVVASVEVPLYMTFHFINAYEERDEQGKVTGIIADCFEHNADPTILENLAISNLRSYGVDILPDARVGRFRIPLNGSGRGELVSALDPDLQGRAKEMCSINPSYRGKKYRYFYACGTQKPCTYLNTITKIDLIEKTAKSWHEEGSVPSEPYFIARPGGTDEDDGVVVSLVSDKDGGGYTVLLDGSSFEEIARAKFPYGLPYGTHGCWIPKN